ncbi:Predicted RNA-binding protein involved in translational regulation [Ceraceosorus bombacis]|uniref:Predicted RNA-binding protein involved in translational regulation n=1 Tax=Ceraceosorus bombacis TaxID=401625 RepID=A0A0P1BNA7_9BASI|nr:Predicted RNA-binding protein involved in translational regulation [Ceraceosorus bombacis]
MAAALQQQGNTAESDAIDKWFEDLRHYEATLEEMAAASLDQNFKEELSAIEQWFRVLSEAERTAALYSLLQESTQVQIRFFITVLQQMARSDPMSALLSPSHPNNMADQMEAKLASLGLKSPSAMKAPASPGGRNLRQSSDAAGFLSPNLASMYGNPPGSAGVGGDAASMLAAQRAKLKSNRISAPGQLPSDAGGRNFSGGSLDQVAEGQDASGNAALRPKSTDGLSQATKSPRANGPLDDQLSPIQSGSWASMVNTPLMPMFDEKAQKGQGASNVDLDAATAQLASVAGGNNASRVMLDPDVAKFRRKSQQGAPGSASQNTNGQSGIHGVLSGMYDAGHSPGASPNMPGSATSPGPWNATQNDFLRHAMANVSPAASQGGFNMAMSPNALAGLQSPSGGLGNPVNMQMMNAMAAMGGLSNMSAAQFLAMQQSILQAQTQAAAAAAGSAFRQPASGRGNSAFSAGLSPPASMANSGRRSPGTARTPNTARSGAPSSAGPGGEEEVAPLSVLEDVPAWLRYLRLHKYTPNFEKSNWKEMVQMDEKALEEKGVAALGARRKMLKTFELMTKRAFGVVR